MRKAFYVLTLSSLIFGKSEPISVYVESSLKPSEAASAGKIAEAEEPEAR